MHEQSTVPRPPDSQTNQNTGNSTDSNYNAFGHEIGFGEALRVWLRIALLSFGGASRPNCRNASYFGG